jgi:hypothetical protein
MAKRGVAREEQAALIASSDAEIVPSSYDHDIEKDMGAPPIPFSRQNVSKVEQLLGQKSVQRILAVLGVLVIVVQAMSINNLDGTDSAEDMAENSCYLAIFCGAVGLLFAYRKVQSVMAKPEGNLKMKEIATAIQDGAYAFLYQEYKWLFVFCVFTAFVLAVGIGEFTTATCFVIGALISGTAGWIGMSIAVRGNVRTAAAAVNGLDPALRVAFDTGTVMGMVVVSSGTL